MADETQLAQQPAGKDDKRKHENPTPSVSGGAGHESSTDAPQFVAPASYLRSAPVPLRPLSRAQTPVSGGSGSRPGTRDSIQMKQPLDREQIEGLVSWHYMCGSVGMWLTALLSAMYSVRFVPFSRCARVTMSCH